MTQDDFGPYAFLRIYTLTHLIVNNCHITITKIIDKEEEKQS